MYTLSMMVMVIFTGNEYRIVSCGWGLLWLTRIYRDVQGWRHRWSTIRLNSWWNYFVYGLVSVTVMSSFETYPSVSLTWGLHYPHRVSSFSVVQRKCLHVININIIEDNKTKVFDSIHLSKDVMRLQQVVAVIPLLSCIIWLFVIAF